MRAKSVVNEEERHDYSRGWLIVSASRVVRNLFIQMCHLRDWISQPWGHVLEIQSLTWLFGFQLHVVLCQSYSQTADSSPVPHFSRLSVLRSASHAHFAFIENPKWTPVWIFTVSFSRANEGSKSVALRNAAGAKELISSAGSQPPGACV